GPAALAVTDEERIERVYRVEAPDSVSFGNPVAWVERGPWLQPAEGSDAGRKVLVAIDAKNRADTRSFVVDPDLKARLVHVDRTHHTLHGLFRGQRFEAKTSIELHRVPEIVADQYRMPLGAVAVQAPKELCDKYRAENTAIAILLDCSGSMCYPFEPGKPVPPGKQRRFDKALDALEGVLKRLPAGVTVSLRTFSQREDNGAFKVLWSQVKWDPAAIGSRMEQMRRLQPWSETPLVRALEETRKDFPAGFRGFKTIVVITDGGDSDEKNVPVNEIPDRLLRAFQGSGILINAIGFDMSFGS